MYLSHRYRTFTKPFALITLALALAFGSGGAAWAQVMPSSLHVVTVGVGKYQNNYQRPLKGTVKDATDMAEWCQQQKGKLSQHVETTALINQYATADNILNTLSQLKYETNDSSLVIFHVASHGSTSQSLGYRFCAYDRPVQWREVLTVLQGVRGHVVVFLDTCQSAGAMNYGNVMVFAGCQVNENSYEEPPHFGMPGNGYFTKYALQGMAGAADADQNGIVTLGELGKYVPAWVSYTVQHNNGKSQQPVLMSSLYVANELALSQLHASAQSEPGIPSNPSNSTGPITSSGPLSNCTDSNCPPTTPAAPQPIEGSGPLVAN